MLQAVSSPTAQRTRLPRTRSLVCSALLSRPEIQSHGLGGVQDRHYDQYEYIKQKRKALLKWEKFLDSIAARNPPLAR
jgi:hypothetical protein